MQNKNGIDNKGFSRRPFEFQLQFLPRSALQESSDHTKEHKQHASRHLQTSEEFLQM